MSSPAAQLRHRVPRIAGAAVERARLTVVPRARSRAPRVPFVTLVSLVLVGGVVGLLLFNTSMQQSSFAATSLEEQASALAAREQTLQMELDDLRNPQRVATEAQRMGMVIPTAPTFITLDGEVRGERLPAAADNRLNLAPQPVPKPAVLTPRTTVVKVEGSATGRGRAGRSADQTGGRSEGQSGR